ncbi:sensor histidine kinase [Clostridium mediterraneense]|uniref:sensor histidine kinase n=1 Tax=Clostridium mediterraneense TaxID=1805472 RepID=UPI0008349C59|nr:HAMP domain-containing sensor histidine kinase [Clostridium mediterraneense]
MAIKFKNKFREIFNLKSVYKLKRKLINKKNIILLIVIVGILVNSFSAIKKINPAYKTEKIRNFTHSTAFKEKILKDVENVMIPSIRAKMLSDNKDAYLGNIIYIKQNNIKKARQEYEKSLEKLNTQKEEEYTSILNLYAIDISKYEDENRMVLDTLKKALDEESKNNKDIKLEYERVKKYYNDEESKRKKIYQDRLVEIDKEVEERRNIDSLEQNKIKKDLGYYFEINAVNDNQYNEPLIKSEKIIEKDKDKILIKYMNTGYGAEITYSTGGTNWGIENYSKEYSDSIFNRVKDEGPSKENIEYAEKYSRVSPIYALQIKFDVEDLENKHNPFYKIYKDAELNVDMHDIIFLMIPNIILLICLMFIVLGMKFYDKLIFKYYRKIYIEISYMVFSYSMFIFIMQGFPSSIINGFGDRNISKVLYIGLFIIIILFGSDIAYFSRNGFKKALKDRSGVYKIGSKSKEFFRNKILATNTSINKLFIIQLIICIILNYIYIKIVNSMYIWYGYFNSIMTGFTIVVSIIMSIILVYKNYRYMKDIKDIEEVSSKIAKGEFNIKFKSNEVKNFNNIRENLSNINKGFKIAIEDEIKSERMKSELLTNVSHDLKTPLTSIINYVDLLQRDNLTEEQKEEYIKILDNKSKRLKVLIEDLFEASKASTGNIKLNKEDIDIVAILRQSMGEFKEKIDERNLNFKLNISSNKIILNLDGARTWRVFENLIGNALKYSMEHTRVYIDLRETSEDVIFEIKNISGYELNCEVSELKERFKRADLSRNTEGSGLGLSIANSLVELQGGKLDISIDGDLFKVKVIFKK